VYKCSFFYFLGLWLLGLFSFPFLEEGKKKKGKKKRVHFAEDVVDPRGDGEEFRRQHEAVFLSQNSCSSSSTSTEFKKNGQQRRMPANRAALYNGILRDRGVQRLAYSC